MAILVQVDCETAKRYNCRSISTKYNNKKHKVYFKLTCDDFTLAEALQIAKTNSNILMVEYKGLTTNPDYMAIQDNSVYIGRLYDLGNNICSHDLKMIMDETPAGVTPIVGLPNDFKDMELLWKLSKEFPKFRFYGGDLFSIDGIKIGCIGVDILDKREIKYGVDAYRSTNSLDALETVDLLGLELEVSNKPEKTVKAHSNKSNNTNSPAKKQKTMLFSDIFNKNTAVAP